MKKISNLPFLTSLLFLLGATAVPAQSAFFQAVTNLNPVGYWPLQENVPPPGAHVETNLGSLGPSGNAYYSSTNATPGAPTYVAGDAGAAAVSFRGAPAGAFLAVPMTSPQVSVPGPFSVEAWVYPTNSTATGNTIMSQTGPSGSGGQNGSTNSAGWSLSQNYIPSENQTGLYGWSFHVFNGVGPFGGAEAVAVVPTGALPANQWYHIVGVFDGVNASLYVNGVYASANTYANNSTFSGYQIPLKGSYQQDTWTPLTIGCGRAFNANQYYGYMAELAVYTYALSSTQIANHYSQFNQTTYTNTILGDSPYMYWRLNAPPVPAPSAYPVAGNYGSAASVGGLYLPGTTPGVAGPSYAGLAPSYACAFNGIGTDSTNTSGIYTNGMLFRTNVLDTAVLVTNLTTALVTTNTNITAMVWFKANPADVRFQGLIGLGNSSWRLSLDGTSGKVHWNQGAGGEITSAHIYNDGLWHFAVGVYTNAGTTATGTNYLYVDGVLDTVIPATGNTVGTTTNLLLGGAPDYYINGNGSAYNQRFFAGSLAHAAYFTNALSAAQIQSLYSAAEPPPAIVALAVLTTNYVGGASTLAYQWYYNSTSNYSGATAQSDGGRISGSQTANFTITGLQSSDSGYYYVVVTNNYGAVTSLLSQLVISPSPTILAQVPGGPFSLTVGQGYTLSVTAAGGGALSYQWYTNGLADTTAGTGASYVVTNVPLALNGATYQCVVTAGSSSATSAVSTLTVVNFTNTYSTTLLGLHPNAYWPMHEVATPAPGDIETNLGSLGALGNAYYGDWDSSLNAGIISHRTPGALAGDSDPSTAFSGVAGSYMIVPHVSPLATIRSPYTVECWLKPLNSHSYQVIVGQGGGSGLNGSANYGGFALQWSGTPNSFSMVLWNGTGSGNYEQKTTTVYPAGQWYHLVCTVNGSNVNYYVNGNLAQYGVLQSGPPAPMNPDSWSPLVIGGGRWGSTGPATGSLYEGQLDEVAIYTNILAANRISAHFNDGTNTVPGAYESDVLADNPLLYYRMDAPSYSLPSGNAWPVVHNYGSNGPNGHYSPGTQVGTATITESGLAPLGLPAGVAVSPGNGMSSFADLGFDPSWDPVNYANFSFTAWFKGYPGDDRSFQGIMSGNDSTWRCSINSSGTVQAHGCGSDITSPKAYNDGNWHLMVTTTTVFTNNSHVTNLQSLYIDGALVITNLTASTNNPTSGQPGPEMFAGNECNYTNNPVGPGRSFAGMVCEAAFFSNTVLSAVQISNLWAAMGLPAYITTQPASAILNEGSAFTNSVVANGSPTLTYQWYKNNQALPLAGQTNLPFGATNASLVINPLQLSDISTNYYVVVSNPAGHVQSATWSLAENTVAVITNQLPVPYTNLFSLCGRQSDVLGVCGRGQSALLPMVHQRHQGRGRDQQQLYGKQRANGLSYQLLRGVELPGHGHEHGMAGASFGGAVGALPTSSAGAASAGLLAA